MTASPARNPLAIRDFRLLWVGEAISGLGDQFALIALPWLALVLTGSALALGSVLALMSVPRALLMLVGGVSVDRLSPRRVMLAANTVRLAAVAALGVTVLAGAAELWMLYAFAVAFGVADAFFFPAQTAIVPELVQPDQLQRANGLVQGTMQATILLGPVVAGVVIATLGGGTSTPAAADVAASSLGAAGIAAALIVDAFSFLASLVTLILIRPRAAAARTAASVLDDIRAGVRFVTSSRALRSIILLSLTANLLVVGPFEVGVPVLAYSRLPEGAAAFGLLLAAFGGGSLGGLVIGAVLPNPRPSRFAFAVIGTMALAGFGLAALTLVHETWVGLAVNAVAGVALGYSNLLGMTWMQRRIPSELMGRAMSVMMLGSVGLVPVSMLIAGAAVQVSLDGMLLVAGLGMALLSAGSLLSPTIRNLGLQPPHEPEGAMIAEPAPAIP